MCSFCVRLCGWTRSLCLSALPSTWRGNQNGYRCSSSALPISGWRFCDALSDRCFAGGSLILCVSLPGPEAVLARSRFCRFPDGSGLYSLPGLETLLCRAHCACTADEICTCTAVDFFTSTVFWSVPNKDSVCTRYWISSFLYRDIQYISPINFKKGLLSLHYCKEILQ